jgi:hypothetical protein
MILPFRADDPLRMKCVVFRKLMIIPEMVSSIEEADCDAIQYHGTKIPRLVNLSLEGVEIKRESIEWGDPPVEWIRPAVCEMTADLIGGSTIVAERNNVSISSACPK